MTKEEAIEILKQMPIPKGCNDNVHSTPYGYEYMEAISMATEALKSTDSWMPVTKRLPESSDIYLVTLDWGVHGCGIIITFYDILKGWDKRFETNITAWMPAPDPYRKINRTGGEIDVLLDHFKQDKQ